MDAVCSLQAPARVITSCTKLCTAMLSKLHGLERVHALHKLDLCTFMLSTIVCVDITTAPSETTVQGHALQTARARAGSCSPQS